MLWNLNVSSVVRRRVISCGGRTQPRWSPGKTGDDALFLQTLGLHP